MVPALASQSASVPALDVATVVKDLSFTLLNSIDTIYELMFAYSAELEKDRERIEAEAYDSDIMEAFTAILSLAFPFGAMAGRVMSLVPNGSTAK